MLFRSHALALLHDLDDPEGEAVALMGLGYVHHHLGNQPLTITNYQRAISRWRELGDRPKEGRTLTDLGDIHLAAGNRPAAHDAWQQALAIFDELGSGTDIGKVRTKLDQLVENHPRHGQPRHDVLP